ncbi:MAG TPA: hypothetical protein VHK69_19455 [Chitinophagaceae bacterium]|jgi:hypothetical protein|nr:hypothetical protein [Chitinophagaceae bacterium]
MKNWISALCVLLVTLASCSKEKSFELPAGATPGGGNPNDPGTDNPNGLLRRQVLMESPEDSMTTTFTYDAQNRVTGWKSTATFTGFEEEIKITRGNGGIISKVVLFSDDLNGTDLDSVVYEVHYSNNRYAYKIHRFEIANITYADSIVYEYNNAGQIERERIFSVYPDGTSAETERREYAYANGNLVTYEFYMNEGSGDFVLNDTYTYEHDTKKAPLVMGNEALVAGSFFFGPNNITRETIVEANNPGNSDQTSIQYTYNIADKPSLGAVTYGASGGTAEVKYYYQ